MLIIDPPATAGGTDIYPSEMLTFEAKDTMRALPLKSPLTQNPNGLTQKSGTEVSAMNDASRRKLAEIQAGIRSGKNLYQLQKECNEYLLLSFDGYKPKSEKSDDADNGEQDDRNTKGQAANAVEHSDIVVCLVNRLKRVTSKFVNRFIGFRL
jgi:hypothetical protein